jgi:hypothetical protein
MLGKCSAEQLYIIVAAFAELQFYSGHQSSDGLAHPDLQDAARVRLIVLCMLPDKQQNMELAV